MYITTNGIVLNDQNELLLIRRNDSRTLAPPGGGLDWGELPPDGAVREVKEETGLNVTAERLVAAYFWPNEPIPYLTFSFRCKLVDGTLRPSLESPQVGYVNCQKLPLLLLPFHRHRVKIGIAHQGTVPYWGVQNMNFYEDLGKRILGRTIYPYWRWRARRRNIDVSNLGFVQWQSGAFCVIRNEAEAVLWVKRTDYDAWNLPGGSGEEGEAPWDTAVRETKEETGLDVNLTNLSGVYLYNDKRHVIFVFEATTSGGTLQTGPESAAFAHFTPGQEPPNSIPQHIERVADTVDDPHQTTFRFQSSLVKTEERKE